MWAPHSSAIEDEESGAHKVSALSVADSVVKEYEKLLAAIPTMAKHMGKLQLDTETMADGEQARTGPCRGSLRSCIRETVHQKHGTAYHFVRSVGHP